jgi:hypothetical protein
MAPHDVLCRKSIHWWQRVLNRVRGVSFSFSFQFYCRADAGIQEFWQRVVSQSIRVDLKAATYSG